MHLTEQAHVSNEKAGHWLFRVCTGLYYPVLVGIMINQYKSPYETTSIIESRRVFSHGLFEICWDLYQHVSPIRS